MLAFYILFVRGILWVFNCSWPYKRVFGNSGPIFSVIRVCAAGYYVLPTRSIFSVFTLDAELIFFELM